MTKEQCSREFGKNLEYFLKRYRISQNELAEYLGVNRVTVNHYLNGKREPSLHTIVDIIYFVGCKFEDLVDPDSLVK